MSSPTNANDNNESEEEKVVIEQRLLKIDECFIYRIPPMRSADGHRAEDWNLAKPLHATCSLTVARRDNDLVVNIMAERPKPNAPPGAMEQYLFAQSLIQVDFSNPSHKIEHWVNPVVDSSRYFAVRIKDSKTGREAFIGVGFRERTDATNVRMSIEDYINSLKREEKAAEMQRQFKESLTVGGDEEGSEGTSVDTEKLPLPKSSLSLREGEKIHINIKGNKSSSPKPKKGNVGLLGGLKKPPPPPPDATPASDSSAEQGSTATESGAITKSNNAVDDDWGDFQG